MDPAERPERRCNADPAPFREGRALHLHIRTTVELALGDRSWKWLAHQIGVPQSTLSGQVSKPKFSLDVVWRMARVLDLDLQDLLGPPNRETDSR